MSLRSRLFGTYALVIAVCLAIVAVAITAVFQGYRDRLAMDRLDNMARPISVQIRSIVSTTTTIDRLWANLEEQAQRNNVYIIVGRRDGTVVRQITPSLDAKPIEVAPRFMPHPVLKAVLGRFTATDGKVFVYAAYPLARLQTALPLQADDVVLATPRTGSLSILAGLMLPLIAGGIVALLVSLFVAMILARSFSKPLNDMGSAARRIAAGDYDHTVPIEGPEEIRELAKDFNQMTGEVKRSQQQLRHFVADVSHELKSPLTSIQGFSQALVDGTAADETTRSKAAGIINSESRRMRRQVDELLELSRMQSGQFKIAKEPTDVSAVVSRCAEIFKLQAHERGLTLEVTVPGQLLISGDSDRLEQLFSNLLDNAIKNTQAGGRVAISCEETSGKAIVSITDNGPGIPEDQLPFVFDRFYQVTGLRTGVGLGLAIAKEITNAHGGSIEARSSPGEGAQFVVTLPLAG